MFSVFLLILPLIAVAKPMPSGIATGRGTANPSGSDDLSRRQTDSCVGYVAKSVKQSGSKLAATLELIGDGCAVYGPDVKVLTLHVEYEESAFFRLWRRCQPSKLKSMCRNSNPRQDHRRQLCPIRSARICICLSSVVIQRVTYQLRHCVLAYRVAVHFFHLSSLDQRSSL